LIQSMSGANAQSVSEAQRKQMAQALGDFQYDLLRADLLSEAGRIKANVHIAGRGRSGAKTPLDVELHVTGINAALGLGLGLKSMLSPGD
jgi:hypothetical protein